jgi:hypothetical protein
MLSRPRPRTAAAALAVWLAGALPCLAQDPVPKAAAPRPLTRAALEATARLDARALAQATTGAPAPAERGKPFFKTSRGIAVLALMVVGTGWVVYSKFNDRVTSPAS